MDVYEPRKDHRKDQQVLISFFDNLESEVLEWTDDATTLLVGMAIDSNARKINEKNIKKIISMTNYVNLAQEFKDAIKIRAVIEMNEKLSTIM